MDSIFRFGRRAAFVAAALLALARVGAAQDAAAAGRSAPAALPNAPSSVLEQAAQMDAALSKTAGSGATYTAAGTVKGPDGVAVEQGSAEPLKLSLDDAISYGFERNVRLKYDRANQREVKGLQGTVFAALIPNLKASFSSGAQEINLAGMGFKPSLLAEFSQKFGFNLSAFSTIVKVNTTQAQISASQQFFNLPDYELYRGAKSEKAVVDLDYLNSRGDLVMAVSDAYLKLLADQANLENAQAQERAAKTVFDQAAAKHEAGVGTNLDALRGQVDYQQRQQGTIAADAAMKKDMIQLNRIMGLPAEQVLELTDTAPFADLAAMDLDVAKATAFAHRKDLLSLQAEIDVEMREYRAVKYQRLPTVAFNGYYGVLGETDGLYHGVFNAVGSVRFPIFREAGQRGEQDEISAQLMALRQREESLRVDIEAQIRTAMLDVDAAHELVKVAQSNVELAQQELSDERDRFKAGVDTDLPVVDAEAAVAGAQAQLVQSLYQYNTAKLTLARNTGVVETRYRTYLGQ